MSAVRRNAATRHATVFLRKTTVQNCLGSQQLHVRNSEASCRNRRLPLLWADHHVAPAGTFSTVAIGSGWRKLNAGRQALLVLVYLRKGETFAEIAAGFGVGTTTAWRYVNETVALLAARAPKLRKAVRDARKAGHAYVVVDGTLIPVDRVAADRPFYSGKHKKHGMNLQVIASPHGDILWVSGALPGSVHDKKAEWIWGVLAELEAAGLITLADKGYQGSTYAKTVLCAIADSRTALESAC